MQLSQKVKKVIVFVRISEDVQNSTSSCPFRKGKKQQCDSSY